MRSAHVALHQRTDGTYRLHVSLWDDGEQLRTLLDEESRPMPELTLSEAWRVGAQMAEDALRAVEPSPGLWGPGPWSHTG